MKIIYEQGDVVYNSNNDSFGVVLSDNNDSVTIVECTNKKVIINNPPKSAITYRAHVNLYNELNSMFLNSMILENILKGI